MMLAKKNDKWINRIYLIAYEHPETEKTILQFERFVFKI